MLKLYLNLIFIRPDDEKIFQSTRFEIYFSCINYALDVSYDIFLGKPGRIEKY
jgi:hypothetical protein